MKAKLAFAAAILLSVIALFGQTIVERTFVMRAETTSVDPYTGMTHTCVLVYPDGRYRMERSFQSNSGGDPDTKIYLDSLPDADLKALQSVLEDRAFVDIKTAPAHGGIIKDMDTLAVTVPREHTMQNLNFNNAAERKPYEKGLKPFQNFLKNLLKRKVQASKGEKGNNCEPPRVLYRSQGMTPMPDSEQ